nr:glucans biosynthesis glucosyltransferase MdoH [Caulobacter hibisci]
MDARLADRLQPCNDVEAAQREAGPEAWLPAEAPLSMPVRVLSAPARGRRRLARSRLSRRLTLLGVTMLAFVFGLSSMLDAFAAGGVSLLEFIDALLVATLLAWTGFSFSASLGGFQLALAKYSWERRLEGPPSSHLKGRVALLAPIYNEDVASVFARLEAMRVDLDRERLSATFDIFVLSDTRNEAIAAAELEAALVARAGPSPTPVYYRRRVDNIDRKTGNIAEWVRRFGGAYECMVVLDADSLINARSLRRMAGAMEADATLGVLQAGTTIVGRSTLLSRAEQFASWVYGPLATWSLAWWSGAEANYFGHNAMIRTRAFAECCGLPHLPGKAPFGGAILSHDFVEAALMRRGGWAVRMAPTLEGVHEEAPPTLSDLLARDRRWCQGNLQHLAILGVKGLHPISRLHLLRGALAYALAPVWLLLVVLSALLAAFPVAGAEDAEFFLVEGAASAFAVSLIFLAAPKVLAVILTCREGHADGYGGVGRLWASVAVETVHSTLAAPAMLFGHARALLDIVAGRDSGWAVQRRDAAGTDWGEALRRHTPEVIAGLALLVCAVLAGPSLGIWILPAALGLAIAPAVSVVTGSARWGLALRRRGLLIVPSELDPSRLLRHAYKRPAEALPELVETAETVAA